MHSSESLKAEGFNIYLRECSKPNHYILEMRPPTQAECNAKRGIALRWPTDPENTGRRGIVEMLNCMKDWTVT